MAGLRESDSITEAVQPTPTCGVREEAHFICGVLEEAVMGFYALSPRVVAEALGLRRLILEPQPREDAETEGTPRLMLGSAGHQTTPQVEVEARGLRPCVFSSRLESGGQLPRHREKDLQDMLKGALIGRDASWIFGGTGVGMSVRVPLAALMATADEVAKGVVHVLPSKLASYSLHKYYQESEDKVVKNMASVWNDDVHLMPTQREFVVFSTPASIYHRLRSASSWQDLSLIVFDEIQVKDGLMALVLVYVLDLIVRRAPCAKGVRVLLMTATPRGPAFSILNSVLDKMGVSAGSVTLSPCESCKPFHRFP